MKLYLILTFAGTVMGTWGPLPYDRTECLARANELRLEVRAAAALNPPTINGVSYQHTDIATHCRRFINRPELGSQFEGAQASNG